MLLPDTLLLRVFTYLGEIELSRVCFVCSRWRTVAGKLRALSFVYSVNGQTAVARRALTLDSIVFF